VREPDIDRQRLVAIFILGGVLFNYPILSLFNKTASVFGIPLLYVYIFLAWGFLIGLVAWVAERRA
jgi:NhaP-type Na+/H+ and K+/H+ antiporter